MLKFQGIVVIRKMFQDPKSAESSFYLDTWTSFEDCSMAESRTAHHFSKFLEPSDEWAGQGYYCFLMWWHCWEILAHQEWAPDIRNELQKLVKLKFEFFSFNTFDVSQILWQWIVQTRPQYSYWIFLKGLCWVSVCWILNNALSSISWLFSGFYFVPHCSRYGKLEWGSLWEV